MKYDVSIVIVCMNNYKILKDCLDSIKEYTKEVNYEVLLVAYFFSNENLDKLKREYPWVKIIISDEIRGFSANNNLALNQARGKYSFILNDDTYFRMNVVGDLFKTMENHPEMAALSPQIVNKNGSIQCCGIPYYSWVDMILTLFKIKTDWNDFKRYGIKTEGLCSSYALVGAAIFAITNVLKEMGYLDETYFYGPEDIALTSQITDSGKQCWVNNNIKLVHLGGASGGKTTKTVEATRPASRKGTAIFHAHGNKTKLFIIESFIWLNSFIWMIGWFFKYVLGSDTAKYSMTANLNVCRTIFSKNSTTEIFKILYKK